MTDLGDRMKAYEGAEVSRRHLPLLPVCVRLDGKNFSRFTKGLQRPYDERLSKLMVGTTRYLVEQTQAVIGYTQSDEISLILWTEDIRRPIFLDGRIQKLTSILAAMSTSWFIRNLDAAIPERAGSTPVFDCRSWTVPSCTEAVNTLIWREMDATKNSISMAARDHYSHAELMGLTGKQQQALLFEKGVNWNDYPSFFKRGTYVQRRSRSQRFSAAEIASLPPLHAARTDPNLEVLRRETVELDLPPLSTVPNRIDVVFHGADWSS